jgi:hypothetical protein
VIKLQAVVPPSVYDRAFFSNLLTERERVPWVLGLEMEYENVRFLPSPEILDNSGWRVVEDRSLRNHGREFKSAGVVFGTTEVESAVEELCAWAKEANYSVSTRTGLHVHMDCRSITTEELARVAALWAIIEERVFAAIPLDRQQGGFCIPWHYGSAAVQPVWRLMSSSGEGAVDLLFEGLDKYTSLNVGPLRQYGSIELRVLPATTSAASVMETLCFCAALMQAGVSLTKEELMDLDPIRALTFMSGLVGGWGNFLDRVVEAPSRAGFDDEIREILVERALGVYYGPNAWGGKVADYLSKAVKVRNPRVKVKPHRTPVDAGAFPHVELDGTEVVTARRRDEALERIRTMAQDRAFAELQLRAAGPVQTAQQLGGGHGTDLTRVRVPTTDNTWVVNYIQNYTEEDNR